MGATNLIPGPNSTEMTMHCGQVRAGWKGRIVAGFCFILPAVIITGLIAWAYEQYGRMPEVKPLLYGIKPAIIAVVISLMVILGKKALKSVTLGVIGAIAALLALWGVNEILILLGGGVAGMLLYLLQHRRNTANGFFPLILLQATELPHAGFDWKLCWIFLKVGALLYGSGYVLFAFLDAELVHTGLLSRQVLIDAIAVRQFTPGPVFSAATFIGWQMAGLPGAIGATVGIFLPSFLFVALLSPLIPKLRQSKIMAAFLDTVNIISVTLILVVCIEMSKEVLVDWSAVVIGLASLGITMIFPKLNSAFIVIGGALCGYLLWLI